ncbi:MFS transporter [Agrobacterium vitis]|nr:MFS transporter [Agrobacterium vitis]
MTKLNSLAGNASLSIAHMAGMIDLAALPLWIGTLMDHYQLSPERAGLTVTAFLAAIVIASLILAPRYNRLNHRVIAFGGFTLATVAFIAISRLSVASDTAISLMILHAIAGLGAGSALSVTHGTFGRTTNPHRIFGLANVLMGLLAIGLFAVLPGILRQFGGSALFVTFALIMAFAALVTILLFPVVEDRGQEAAHNGQSRRRTPLHFTVWPVIGVVVCLAMNQAMVFSFVERLGLEAGFGEGRVQIVLVIMGFINLTPGLLAIALQKRLAPVLVGMVGPFLQAVLSLTMTHATVFPLYAVPVAFYVAIVIFTHVFLFGLLSKIDETGRAVAATPAMMMIGSAIGPALGGGIVGTIGYHGLGWASVCIAAVASTLIFIAWRGLAKDRRLAAITVS